jgi:hypothetical protein
MNLPRFDENRKHETGGSPYGEAVRLANELRSRAARTILDQWGGREDIPARKGFDVETCDLEVLRTWLNNLSIKKSASLIMFVHRIIAVRFPDKYANIQRFVNKSKGFTNEYQLIQSEARNEVEWFGEVGFQNMVRLDGSLSKSHVKPRKVKGGKFTFKRI